MSKDWNYVLWGSRESLGYRLRIFLIHISHHNPTDRTESYLTFMNSRAKQKGYFEPALNFPMTLSPSRPWSSSVDLPLKSSNVFTQSSKLLNSLSRLPSYIFQEKGEEGKSMLRGRKVQD